MENENDVLAQFRKALQLINAQRPNSGQLTPEQEAINQARMGALQNVQQSTPVSPMSNGEIISTGLQALSQGLASTSPQGADNYGSLLSGLGQGLVGAASSIPARQRELEQQQLNNNLKGAQVAGSTELIAPDAVKDIGTAGNLATAISSQQNSAENRKNQLELERMRQERLSNVDKQKQSTAIRKEDTKLADAEFQTQEALNNLQRTQQAFEEYSKSKIGGTGPIATLGGLTAKISPSTQTLDRQFKGLNLEALSKLANGMAKLFDSEGERKIFESAQPNVANTEQANRVIFQEKIRAAQSLLQKTQQARQKLDPNYKPPVSPSSVSNPLTQRPELQQVPGFDQAEYDRYLQEKRRRGL